MADKFVVTLLHKPSSETKIIECCSDEKILDAALDAGIDMPYSCTAGTCATCTGLLISGEVDQSDQSALDEEQLKKGYCLTCVSYPRSNVTIQTHEQENAMC